MKNNYYFLINSLEGGGAERVTINLASTMVGQGRDVYIITLKPTNFYDLPTGVKHIPLSSITNNLLMFACIPWYVFRFKQVIKKYALSEGMSLLEAANFVHILAKKNPVISFRIHISFFTGVLGSIYKFFISLLYPKAGKIIVNSMENKYDLAKYLHISDERIEVLYNPIDKKKIEKMKLEAIPETIARRLHGKKVLITTGRLVWQKHHEKILAALSRMMRAGNTHRIYLIVGDGPERNKIEKIVHTLGLQDNVIFCGEQKNVFKYLYVADVFLYASEVEGFPNVLIEARELGLPIITSDFKSGAKEVILGEYTKNIGKTIIYPYHGKHGVLLDLEDYERQFLNVYKHV